MARAHATAGDAAGVNPDLTKCSDGCNTARVHSPFLSRPEKPMRRTFMSNFARPGLFAALGLFLFLAGCGAPTQNGGAGGRAGGEQVIKIDGSSTVFPVTEAVAEEFQ